MVWNNKKLTRKVCTCQILLIKYILHESLNSNKQKIYSYPEYEQTYIIFYVNVHIKKDYFVD